MSEISKIRCSNGECLNIKDATAREGVASLETRLSSVEGTVSTLTGVDGGSLATDADITNLQDQIDAINNAGFITDEELEDKGYIDAGYLTTNEYVRETTLANYATQSWVTSKNYLTAVPSEYVTETELTSKGYATQTWVTQKNYLTAVPSEYVTETELTAKQYLKGVTLTVSVTNETLEFGLSATK